MLRSPAVNPNSLSEKASVQRPETSVHTVEPEDPKAIGSAHAPQRDILRHNVEGGQAQPHPDTPAGQHATGSFTTQAEGKPRRRAS